MPLLINEHTVSPAQFNEIYHSEKNSRKLGAVMGLPDYVITEVRRQIKQGLRYLKPETVIQKKVAFTINPKRVDNMQTKPTTQPKEPAVATSQAPKALSLDDQILHALANAKTLLLPLQIQKTLHADRMECRDALAHLLAKGLINRLLNGKYTLSQVGADSLKAHGHPVNRKAYDRISYYKKHPEQLKNSKSASSVPANKAPLHIKTESTVAQQPTSASVQSFAINTQEQEAIDNMFGEMLDDQDPNAVDAELAAFESMLTPQLNQVDVKVKILKKIRSHFTGAVGQHLEEIEHFLQQKAG